MGPVQKSANIFVATMAVGSVVAANTIANAKRNKKAKKAKGKKE